MRGLSLRSTRYIFGTTVLLSHFSIFFMFLYFGLIHQFLSITEIIQGILSVAPLSAIYVSLFIKYVASNTSSDIKEIEEKMSIGAFGVQYFVILSFCLALILTPLFLFVTATIAVENIKMFTGLIDTVFSAYLGVIFGSLFPSSILGSARAHS